MARPKKTIEVTGTKPLNEFPVFVNKMTPLAANFDREDLNKIAHKINEIINHLNA